MTENAQPKRHTTSLPETARVLSTVLVPTAARGAIVRRPTGEALVAALSADHKSVGVLRELRRRHGDDPLPLGYTGRRIALVLSPEDVRRLLSETPDTFSPGGAEKRGALNHFQPHGALVSDRRDRPDRRRANEEALAPGQRLHPDAPAIAEHAEEEARSLVRALRGPGPPGGVLDWARFSETFDALARRVVFGRAAAGDRRSTQLLRRLRHRANWSYLLPVDHNRRAEFLDRIRTGIDRAEPGSLAARLGPPGASERPEDQIAHWLFAFDAAAVAAFRSLAVLTSSGPEVDAVRAEALTEDGPDLPMLRAALRESVRLWPTTLVVIRESTRETVWRERSIPPRTAFLVLSSYFHRDPTRLPYADAFAPAIWNDGRAEDDPGIVPFSYGPAGCPGRDLVPLTVSYLLRALFRVGGPLPVGGSPELRTDALPASLNHFDLRFVL
ncbi:cytochrome P450 [Nocardiopsis sp. NPDC006938]|uniref:cytochrome P450 n=1 Tax=Nocardiopsis sp. NPDC006938 TaxID=3364337 RepID=UPI0036A2B0CD